MSECEEKITRSVELAKCGFENAQERITAIDSKVAVAVGFLVVLLPVPLVVAGWLSGLSGPAAINIYWASFHCWIASFGAVLLLLTGMVCALCALFHGFSCLTPRGPKGFAKCGPFQNEWQPNVLFPIYSPEKTSQFCDHLKLLHSGVEMTFVMNQYDHQLQQLGRILEAKFTAMVACFSWLKASMFFYGLSILFAGWIVFNAVLHGATESQRDEVRSSQSLSEK